MIEKGQAAITDALYFLLIVTFLSVFLFGFANSYGSSIREQISDEYSTIFATNALKSILYTSTPRDPDQDVFNLSPDMEVDYLLAMVKEDYADDRVIDENQRKVFGKTISKILSPIGDTFDYIFLIHVPNDQEIVYLFIHTTNFDDPVPVLQVRDFYIYSAVEDIASTPKDESHANYFCALSSITATGPVPCVEYDLLMNALRKLRANVGSVSEASSAINLIDGSTSDLRSYNAQVDLIMWDSVWLGETKDRDVPLFYREFPDDVSDIHGGWGDCEEAEFY